VLFVEITSMLPCSTKAVPKSSAKGARYRGRRPLSTSRHTRSRADTKGGKVPLPLPEKEEEEGEASATVA
jgi:hypothetical protein